MKGLEDWSPVQAAGKIGNKYKAECRSAAVTFAAGLLIHLYVITNKFFNYFEMGNIFSTMSYAQGDSLGLGRWFLPVATNLFTVFSSPLLNGVTVLAYMTAAAVMICNLFRIKKLFARCLFGMAWVSFPGLASVFSYGVNSDAIVLAALLAVAAVYAAERFKWRGHAAGVVLIALSIGTYQPMLAIAIGVSFGVLFLSLLDGRYEARSFWGHVARLLGMLAAGFILYYIILQIILSVTGLELSGYRGVDSMTSFTPKGIAKGLVYTYGYFFRYFFTVNYQYSYVRAAFNIAGAFLFLFYALRTCLCWKGEGIRKGLFLLLLAFLPLGVNAAPFLMADRVGAGVDLYMMFPLMLLWALFIRAAELEKPGEGLLKWAGVLVLAACIFSGYTVCNQAYHRMDAMTRATGSLIERIAARMEAQPEWHAGIPVYFVNPEALINENYEVELPYYEELKNLPGTEIKPWYNEDALKNYMEVYLHFPVRVAGEGQKAALDGSEAVRAMPAYPAQGSIQVIDGVMVVKISGMED